MTLYVQVQFLKLKCIENTKSTIKNALKSEKWEKEKRIITEKNITKDQKKMQGAKERYYKDPESRRQYRKRKYQENPEQQKEYIKKEISRKY